MRNSAYGLYLGARTEISLDLKTARATSSRFASTLSCCFRRPPQGQGASSARSVYVLKSQGEDAQEGDLDRERFLNVSAKMIAHLLQTPNAAQDV